MRWKYGGDFAVRFAEIVCNDANEEQTVMIDAAGNAKCHEKITA